MKIFLIGLPGSGKSTIGVALAHRLSMDFVDLDHEIESREGRRVPDIFSAQGEDYFRGVEAGLLREWAGSERSFVMSTGGGTPCFFGGMDLINQNGISIFLDEDIDVIAARLADSKHRPLLASDNAGDMRSKLEKLRGSRLATYEKAAIRITAPSVAKVLQHLAQLGIPG